jgi:diadenylate cyclase
VAVSLLTSLRVLPAFSWLVSNTLPALLLAIPVVFAPEIRRGLERIGRTGSFFSREGFCTEIEKSIHAVTQAGKTLSESKEGGLVVFRRLDPLQEYVKTGVVLNAKVTAELLIQIFHPKTPLHDGAVIIADDTLIAASCVLPLSSSGVLEESPERSMGLRHRAALGIAEESDAVAVVISEETGVISLAYDGNIDRYVPADELEERLAEFFTTEPSGRPFFKQVASILKRDE